MSLKKGTGIGSKIMSAAVGYVVGRDKRAGKIADDSRKHQMKMEYENLRHKNRTDHTIRNSKLRSEHTNNVQDYDMKKRAQQENVQNRKNKIADTRNSLADRRVTLAERKYADTRRGSSSKPNPTSRAYKNYGKARRK